MALDPRTGARVYLEIKDAILSGDLKLRARLDIDTLAARFGASATPVRQALAVLSAERLVSAHVSRGYFVAFWSERELKALYEWRGQLAQMACDTYAPSSSDAPCKGSAPQIYGCLMRRLERDANPELQRAAENADERLRAALVAEAEVVPDLVDEIKVLAGAIKAGETRKLRRRLHAYFRRRVVAAPAIRARASIAALPHNGDQ